MTSFAEELVRVHKEYVRNVPNNYAAIVPRIAKAVSEDDIPGIAEALAGWLRNINLQYYRFRPDEARNLRVQLEPLLTAEWEMLSTLGERCLTTLDRADEQAVLRLFGVFRAKLGPVGTAKALHALAPPFFPMWDNEIARSYGVRLLRVACICASSSGRF